MAVNIHLWRHLLHRVEFDCAVDHRAILNVVRKVTLSTANKLMITTRSATKAAGAILPPVHGVQKQLDHALKPEHDKHAASQNKQKGPTSADAKPKAVVFWQVLLACP